MRVWLLGGFRVSVGSRTIEADAWRLRKAAALVKLLALAHDHRLHREQAMDLLWPDLSTRAASNNLRQVLYGARRILDPAPDSHNRYLSLQDEQLALCPTGDLQVDVDAFEEAAAIARRSRDPVPYRAAIELYTGDLLPEDRYEEWVEGRRENLRQTYLALHIELAGQYEERGQQGLAIQALRKAVAEEPAFEEAYVALMRLYAHSGQPGEALSQYERLRESLARKLGTQPGGTTRRLREDIAAGTFSPDRSQVGSLEQPPDTSKHNLPAARTSFVGRAQEMVEIKRELAMTRLLTLTGAGGSGKTRLALEVSNDLVGAYPEGVWLVELAGLSEGTLVPQALATALGVQEQSDRSLTDTLVDYLREKKVLLVLDNCEHLVDATSRLTSTLLDSYPRLTVLATSREALDVAGEINWPVPALSVPGVQYRLTVDELERYESARLFADRALFVERALYGSSGFALQPDNARAVAEICSRLEGIPLAIELAAAWVGTLSVEQISERLNNSLRLLKSGSQTITLRQRTLRGAMDWSYDLLSEPEQILFRRLSVFAGGWTLEAAEAVGANGNLLQEEVLELLWGLVNKSLVLAETKTEGTARYRMLEPIRQYSREKLEENGEANHVQDRHSAFFLSLAEEAEPELSGARQGLWVERMEADHDNLREALSRFLEAGEGEQGLRFGAALWRFWFARSYLGEGLRWLEQVLAGGDPSASPVRVKALEGMGWITQWRGDYERGQATYDEMFKLSGELGDKGNIATALNGLATGAAQQGDNERARALLQKNLELLRELEEEGNDATALKRFHALNLLGYLAINEEGDYGRGVTLWEEGLALAREAGDPDRVGTTLSNLGYVAVLQGDNERATVLSEEALVFADELGSAGVNIVPEALVNMGLATLGLGEHKRARASFEGALVMSQDVGQKPTIINTLEGMASLAGALREATRAAHLWGAAEAAREATGIALPPGDRALHGPNLGDARSQLGEERWRQALAEGRAMPLEEATKYALFKETDRPEATVPKDEPSAGEPTGELTRREREVATLVARGFTNRQVSFELSISERTAGNHVAKILRKLGLRSRFQIATWATENQLLTPPRPP